MVWARSRSGPAFASFVLVAALSLSVARAGEESPDLDPDTEVARNHFLTGRAAYERGDYRGALAEFERARLVKPLPDLDYNIGRCYDRLEDYPNAVAAYQRFADATHDEEERTTVLARVVELRARLRQLEADKPRPKVTPALALAVAPPPPRPDAARAYRGPLIVGAVAVAALAVGFGLYGSVGAEYDALTRSCAPTCAPSRWHGLQERERAGVGLAIAGGAVAVADVVYFVLVARGRRQTAALRPVPTADLTVGVQP